MNPLSRFLRWLNRPIEVIHSDPSQEVLNRCAADSRFRDLAHPLYGQQRLFIFVGPYTFA